MIVGITTKMLTQTLREQEEDGLLTCTEYAEKVPRVEYRITPAGNTLIPTIQTIMQWAEAQLANRPVIQKD